MAERDFSRKTHRARERHAGPAGATARATAGSLRITAQRRAEREDWDEKLDSDGKLAHGGTRKHIARERRDEAGAKRLRAARPWGGAGSACANVELPVRNCDVDGRAPVNRAADVRL